MPQNNKNLKNIFQKALQFAKSYTSDLYIYILLYFNAKKYFNFPFNLT